MDATPPTDRLLDVTAYHSGTYVTCIYFLHQAFLLRVLLSVLRDNSLQTILAYAPPWHQLVPTPIKSTYLLAWVYLSPNDDGGVFNTSQS